MRGVFTTALLAAMACAQSRQECTHSVELMYLQDASSSFDEVIDIMQQSVRELMENLTAMYDEFKMGIAGFVDKPIPLLGVGAFGNKWSYYDDYCYWSFAPLSTEPEDVELGLADALANIGSGGDVIEAPLDGMAYAAGDPNAGWSTGTHSASGRPLVRVLLVITDNFNHKPGDVANALNWGWHNPRVWHDPVSSSGGFGATEFFEHTTLYADLFNNGDDDDRQDYMRMSSLFYKNDSRRGLTPDEESEFNELIKKFGPYPWPEVSPNPGDGLDPTLCHVTEYIEPQALGDLLRAKGIQPIFVVVGNTPLIGDDAKKCQSESLDNLLCLQDHYKNLLDEMGMSGEPIMLEDNGQLIDKIIEAVSSVTSGECVWATSTEEETEARTTTDPLTTSTETDPVTTSIETDPVTTSIETEPVTTSIETEPVTTSIETDPVTTSIETDPVTTSIETDPVTTSIETNPVTTSIETNPVATSIETNPVATSIETDPVTTSIETNPVTTSIETNPVTTSIETNPVTTSIETNPVTTSLETNPVATSIETNPVATSVETDPVATSVETDPVATSVETDPVATSIETDPVAASIETNPVATAIETDPVATAIETDPVATAIETEPAATATEGNGGTGQETTSGALVIVPPGRGVNMGAIAGAAAGGVAGLTGLGGLVYGMLYRKRSASEESPAEDVELPQDSVEREARDEVTLEMFK